MGWLRSFSAVALLALLTGACGSRIIREPTVTLQSVQLAGLGLRGGTLMVSVEIYNPNRFALNANEVRYDLSIADSTSPQDTAWLDLASGTYEDDFSIGGGQTESVAVPVEFTYEGLGGAAASILSSGGFNYRAKGVVDVSTPIGEYEVPFEKGGLVTLLGSQ